MLLSLNIENFAIVKQLELDFKQGMTAFTGETGAGKSIMIDALMLALGERADSSTVRPGESLCTINALFSFDKQSEPARWLNTHDLSLVDSEILLRRIVYTEGRSKSYINGQLFPLQKVRELSELLVNVHGQHQHQALLDPKTHRLQLDNYANHEILLKKVQALYKAWLEAKHKLEQFNQQIVDPHKIDLITFQINELKSLDLQIDEIDALHAEHQLLHHAQDYLLNTQKIANLLADDDVSIQDLLHQVLQKLQQLPAENKSIRSGIELINTALINCTEAVSEILDFNEAISVDPERLQAIEQRMSLLHTTARKYRIEVHLLANYLEKLTQELAELEQSDQYLKDLEQDCQVKLDQFTKAAFDLRESRQKASVQLAQEITVIIHQLGMPKGQFIIDITPLERPSLLGLDKVEYQVCTNPGMKLDSLAKIASGGELSRIGLAIQMITAAQASTPTLLFDEVDVGIGGATAALVGQLLRQLSQRLQIFCVTHQPQVAAMAHHHFIVEKHIIEQRTFSHVNLLSHDQKVNEIARMLGGLQITQQTLSHAQELLSQSR